MIHEPECPVPGMEGLWGHPLHPEDAESNCICAELRACQERVRASCIEIAESHLDHGWYCGLKEPPCNCGVSKTIAALREVQP